MLDIPHFSLQICSLLLPVAVVCVQSGCLLWPAPGWALTPTPTPPPSCGLAAAISTAPVGQPPCWLPLSPDSMPAPFLYPCRPGVVTASHSSWPLGGFAVFISSDSIQTSKEFVYYVLVNYLLECALRFLPRQKNKNSDWKESGILGPVQFSSIQFSKHVC